MTTTGSSIVSTLGAGSGIDMGKFASDLANAQFQARKDRLTAKSEKISNQISLASKLRNSLSTLAAAFGDRVRTGDLSQTAQLANASVGSVTLAPGFIGKGSYSLEVTALAKSQTLASQPYASAATTVGSGTLTLRFGAVTGATFTADTARAPATIAIAQGATLTEVANAVNASNSGVTAYVATTATGAQLVFKGAEGASNGFIVEATEDSAGSGLALAGWRPETGAPTQLKQASANAAFLLDGIAMTSASNKTSQVAPGISLNLTGTNTGAPTTLSFKDQSANIPGVVQDLVSALNELTGQVRTATDALAGGELNNDPGARALKATLSRLTTTVVMPNADAEAPRTLSDLGIKIERDGSFALDGARLQASIARDPAAVAAMFTTGLYGVYATLDQVSREASRTSDPGTLAGSIARYQAMATQTTKETTKIGEQQEALRQRLTSRFATSDSRVAASQSTLSFLKSQIDAWNSGRD